MAAEESHLHHGEESAVNEEGEPLLLRNRTLDRAAKAQLRRHQGGHNTEETPQQRRRRIVSTLTEKVHAAIWVSLFVVLTKYTQVFQILFLDTHGEESNRCVHFHGAIIVVHHQLLYDT
eukprot:gb/GECG01013521.1/.p1 GENE.gb/GECG01013521.1/~~gb/GECG01013521.1/.p1  ORF type:complete len:119 (+),score=13.77 gb/GECG01013521.1/:1-357(+)